VITKAEAHKIMSDALSATERKNKIFLKNITNFFVRSLTERSVRWLKKEIHAFHFHI